MNKSDNSIKKITNKYIYSLIPLILFGLYKNGVNLYIKGYINIIEMFKPLFILIIGAIIGVSVNIIYEKYIKKNNNNILDIIFSSFHPLYGVLISCITSINTNILLFTIITFSVLFISKFIKSLRLNYISLTSLIIFFIMNIIHKFSFLNIYESSNNFKMNAIDYLLGKGSGGIFTTSILLLIISFIILYNIKPYKRSIPIYSITTFTIIVIFYCVFNNNVENIMNILFTNGIMFSFIYISPEVTSSSYTKVGTCIFGFIVGLITFLLYLINPSLSSLGAIFITSMFNNIIDLKFE